MTYKILNTIGTAYSKAARRILERSAEVDYFDLSQKELLEKIGNYDAVLVGLGLNVNAGVIRKGKRLKLIATATTGLDHIDLDRAARKGIEVLSLKGETKFLKTVTGTAELA